MCISHTFDGPESNSWMSGLIGFVQLPVASSWDEKRSCIRALESFSGVLFFLSASRTMLCVTAHKTTRVLLDPPGSPKIAPTQNRDKI